MCVKYPAYLYTTHAVAAKLLSVCPINRRSWVQSKTPFYLINLIMVLNAHWLSTHL